MTASALAVRAIADGDEAAVEALWRAAGLVVPWNDPQADIALCRGKANATLLVGTLDGRIVATAMAGHDGHRGWIYYLAVAPACRGAGHGRTMTGAAETWLRNAGMPKVQLMVRESNRAVRAFYETLGYAQSPVTVMQKWLVPPP